MTTQRISLYLIFFLPLIFSCKKKEFSFTLKGTVKDETFATFLAGASVSLEEVLSSGSSNSEFIHKTTVSSDGTYELTFPRNKATKYILKIEKENYFEIYQEIPFSDFSTEEALVRDYQTNAKAWVKLRFINSLPSSPTDEFRYTKQQGKSGCTECCPTSEQKIIGTQEYSVICPNNGNTIYSYYYFATNPAANGLEEINTPAFDTVELVHYW